VLSEHTELNRLGAVTALWFTEDATQLLVGGETGQIEVWRVDESGLMARAHALRKHRRSVRGLACNPSGKIVVSGSVDGEVIWQQSSEGGKSESLKAFHSGVQAIHLPSRGTNLLASDGSRLLTINLRSHEIVRNISLESYPTDVVAFSPDGAELALARRRKIGIWDTQTGLRLTELTDERQTQWSAIFIPNGQGLLSGGSGRITAWDVEKSAVGQQFKMGTRYVKSIAVSRDGSLVAAVGHAPLQTLQVVRIPSDG